ncbi:MAG: hypothetical protein JSV42_08300 [Chloroflexota bacterium]|nr:MAG: hypothetical protein JSV42_08300 [Chloroflexota bacterium]
MKHPLRLFTLSVNIILLLTVSLGVAFSAGTPVVSGGTNPAAILLGGVRFRELATANDNNIYLGIPDLGNAAQRNQIGLTWGASNTFSLEYDASLEKLSVTIHNGTTETSLEYPGFTTYSNQVRDLVFGGNQTLADYALNNLNYMQISTTLREGSPAQLSLDEVYLDGILLGPGTFPGVYHGTQFWQVANYDFSSGFTLTGVFNLSGLTSPSGELNHVEIAFGTTDVNPSAPLTSNVLATPNPVPLGGSVTLTATIDDTTTGGSNIQSAEYQIGSGGWTAMSAEDGAFDSATENVTANFNAPTTSGQYPVCVRGTDTTPLTGIEECVTLLVGNQGPLTFAVTVIPDKVAGGMSVSLSATVDDSTTGGGTILSAEYSVDGGIWTGMVAQDGSFDSTTEVVSGSFLAPLPSGEKNVCVRGKDTDLYVGPESCTTLTVDSQGPLTSSLVALPNPSDPSAQVTVTATVDDTASGNTNIQSAEYQLDGGAWFAMSAQDGSFDSASEVVTAQFNAPEHNSSVEICVQGKDFLANVGVKTCTQLTVTSPGSPPGPLFLPIVINN